MCIDITGFASPCHQSALVPESPVPSLVCKNAVGIDRFACAKDPTGSVVAVNPPNCTSGGVIDAMGEFGGRGANFECNDGKYKVTAGGYGYRDKEPIQDLPGVQVRVKTVYIQPGDDKLFDISLASGIGVFNVTEFTSAFGSVSACRQEKRVCTRLWLTRRCAGIRTRGSPGVGPPHAHALHFRHCGDGRPRLARSVPLGRGVGGGSLE